MSGNPYQQTMDQEANYLPQAPTQFPEQVNPPAKGPGKSGAIDALRELWAKLTDQQRDHDPRAMSGMDPLPESDQVGGRTVKMSPMDLARLFKGEGDRGERPATGGAVEQATGGRGAVSEGDGPVTRGARRGSSQGGRPSSPGTTNGAEAVTQVQQQGGQGQQQDPMMAQLKSMFDKMDGKKGETDMTPLLALTDAWTGSHFAQSYDRPLTEKQIETMKMQMAEQMARRQADIQYHKDLIDSRIHGADQRLAGVQDTNQTRENVAGTMAGARLGAANINAAARGDKAPPAISPDERSLKSHFAPQVKSYLQSNFDDPTGGKAIGGAAVEAHGQLMGMARALMTKNPQAYPDLRTAYQQAVQDLPVVGGRFTGLKPRGGGAKPYGKGGGDDAD